MWYTKGMENTKENEVSGRKCDFCNSMDAYPLTHGAERIATVCESCYERGVGKSIRIAEAR